MNIVRSLVGSGIAASLVFAAFETEAQACGGCFTPTENPTVVTDHRMVFSVSQTQSTLYDQIRYTGSPSSFGWVLPFSGEIQVGTSSDQLFGALDSLTQTSIIAPPQNCPARPNDCSSGLYASGAAAPAEDGKKAGVDVLKHEVVGPYETVQLAATNPTALEDWLAKNGYNVPEDVKPVIAAYQGEHFNFLAVKLVPGKDVQDMRPIRVTTKGANVALPLRMVAAGAGASVGITLWIIAEGRYQPQNFASFQINANELTWDWKQNKSNYVDLRAQKSGNGASWEIESAIPTERTQVQQYLGYRPYNPAGTGTGEDEVGGYTSEKDAQGTVTKDASTVQAEDLATLFAGIPEGSEHITRTRADLAHAALNTDLVVTAAPDQTQLPTVRQVTKELNEPQCPVYDGCEQKGTAPRSQAISETNDNNDGCKITPRASGSWLVVGLAFVAMAFGRRRNRK